MTTRSSERERAIRAKMVARYQNKKQLGSAIGTIGIGCDAPNRSVGGENEEITAATSPQQKGGRCSSNSIGGAKSVAAAAAMTAASPLKSTSAATKNNATPQYSANLSNNSASTTAEETATTKPKERASLSDAKKKLAASRMAVAAALPSPPTTPRGQQQPSTPKANTSYSYITSPRANNIGNRSFSTSPRHQPKQQQQLQPRIQTQTNATTLKAQRERFLRIKQQNRPAGKSDNGCTTPSSPSSFTSSINPISTHSRQEMQLTSTQSKEHQHKLQEYLRARERPNPSSTQILSTTSSLTTTTAKQQLRMKIIYQCDESIQFDDDVRDDDDYGGGDHDDGDKREGESNLIGLPEEERFREKPQFQKLLQSPPPPQQQQQCQKQEVYLKRNGGPAPVNTSYLSSHSSDGSGSNLGLHFNGNSDADDGDGDCDHSLVGDIDATVSDSSLLQLPSKQSVGSVIEGQDSGGITNNSDDSDGYNDNGNKCVGESVEATINESGDMKEMMVSVVEMQSSDAESECHLGNVVLESDDNGDISTTASASPDLPTNCFHDSGDLFAFKKFENDESMTNARRVVRDTLDNNPKKVDPRVGKDNAILETAWPDDSFSPTAWVTPQAELSFGESSDPWNAHFSQSKSSSEASGPDGWKGSESKIFDLPAPEYKKSQQTRSDDPQLVSAEPNSSNSAHDRDVIDNSRNEENEAWRSTSNNTSENNADANGQQLQDENNDNCEIPCKDQKNDQNEHGESIVVDWKSTTSSTAYVGFGGVLHSGQLSCTESRDDDDETDVDDIFLLGDNITDDELISRSGSEETVATATEFDPISMFGEELESEDIFSEAPTCVKDAAPHPASTVVVGINNTENHAGSALVNMNVPMAVDSPTGSESLGSWWQSRHALTQNSDINAAVKEVLMKRIVFETSPSTEKHSEPAPKAYACSQVAGGACQRENNLPILHAVDETCQNDDEDDSIFSGLEDPLLTKALGVSPAPRLPLPLVYNSTSAFDPRTQILDDDVFSGVSVSSRQEFNSVRFPRLKEANAMKSLLDGTSTTADSPSIQQPPLHSGIVESQNEERFSGTQSEKRTVPTSKHSVELFPSSEGYGVINFQKIENSPTNASVTSDLTSSVIFGGGVFRKPSFMKPIDILETTIETFDQELLVDRSIPDPPTSSLEKIELSDNPHGAFFVEISNPVRSKDQITPLHGSNFSKLASRGDSVVDPGPRTTTSSPNDPLSHLKAQFLTKSMRQQEARKAAPDDRSHTNCPDGRRVAESGNKSKMAFLSQLACGAFRASSFAFCASDSERIASPRKEEILRRDVDLKISGQMDSQLVARSNSESCGSTMMVSQGSESVCSNEKKLHNSNSNVQSTIDESSDTQLVASKDCEDQFNSRSFGTSVDESESANKESVDGRSASVGDEHCTRVDSHDSSYEVASLPSRNIESRDDTDSRARSGNYLTSEARSNAYHKLLLYAYTALSVPPPPKVVEKGEEIEKERVIYPPVLSPHDDLVGRSKEMSNILDRLSSEGVEVLKLCREKKWQPRFLRVTKEVMWFRKDVRFCGIDSYPRGLLWVKKSDQEKQHSLSSINKNGQGGLLFSAIKYISMMKDNHPLSRKQKKGKFKDSITLVLHSCSNETKREILFRCVNKDEAFALSSAFQAILDRLGDDNHTNQRSRIVELKVNAITTESLGQHPNPKTPLALSKAFSPRANVDRWEL